MNESKQRNLIISNLIKIQRHIVKRIVWPYSFEEDSLIRWRAVILSSILLAGLFFGFFAFIAAAVLIIQKNAWGLALVDILGLIICLTFIFVHRIRFEIRASISLLMFYVIGVAIVLSVGPLSGGPAWLFAFAVIAGVLMGGYAAFVAILMNAIFISTVGILISTGKYGSGFPFFNTPQAMIAAGVNFIVLNAITAVSVSALVKGLFHIFKKKEELANGLEKERFELTETKKSLEESKKQFSLFIDSSPDLCFLKDMSGRYLMVNKKNAQFFGKEKFDILGKTDFDLMPNDAAEKCRASDLGAIKAKTIIVSEEKVDDRIYETRKIPIIENHTVVGIAGIIRDISDQKKIENELKESEKKYKYLFENAPSGMYEIDFIRGKFINVNEIMCKYCGYSEEEFLAMNPLDLLTEDSKIEFLGRLQKILAGEKISDNIEYYILTKKGQKLCVILNSDFIYEKGKLTGARVVAHNITELKRAEEEKINAQKIIGEQKKLALVGQVAGKIALDFNNILGIIMGTAELSIMDCENEITKKTFELIFEQTLRGKNLTRNLIAFAKNQEPKQELLKITEKIDLVISLLKKDLEGIEVIRNDKEDIPALIADPGMIEHALVNLVQNSIHAMSKVKNPRLIIRTYCHGNDICFEIEDNGCGIPKEYFDEIYEPSFTLKGSKDISGSYENGIKGTGYGLSNVKKYIEQHNGTIVFESELGSGTKFIISLPVLKRELIAAPEEKTEVQKEILHFGKRILVVEDETAISDIKQVILTHEPYNHSVDIAQIGQTAIDLFEKNEYDFVSLDYILPGKINGMDVYNYIRAQNKIIPILFSSGNIEFLELIEDLKKNDIYLDHLSKPFQNKDYIKSINSLLDNTLKI